MIYVGPLLFREGFTIGWVRWIRCRTSVFFYKWSLTQTRIQLPLLFFFSVGKTKGIKETIYNLYFFSIKKTPLCTNAILYEKSLIFKFFYYRLMYGHHSLYGLLLKLVKTIMSTSQYTEHRFAKFYLHRWRLIYS